MAYLLEVLLPPPPAQNQRLPVSMAVLTPVLVDIFALELTGEL